MKHLPMGTVIRSLVDNDLGFICFYDPKDESYVAFWIRNETIENVDINDRNFQIISRMIQENNEK